MDNRYEVQLNLIKHSEKPHCHKCNMLSLILVNGYRWFLQQINSPKELELFSAPGSIITMGQMIHNWPEYYEKYSPINESEAEKNIFNS